MKYSKKSQKITKLFEVSCCHLEAPSTVTCKKKRTSKAASTRASSPCPHSRVPCSERRRRHTPAADLPPAPCAPASPTPCALRRRLPCTLHAAPAPVDDGGGVAAPADNGAGARGARRLRPRLPHPHLAKVRPCARSAGREGGAGSVLLPTGSRTPDPDPPAVRFAFCVWLSLLDIFFVRYL